MKKFITLFKKVDGKKILLQYMRNRMILFALLQTIFQGISNKSLEIVRLSVNNKVLNKLRKKYKGRIKEFIEIEDTKSLKRDKSNKIWFCWLQGIENAPDIVKKCHKSLEEHLEDREIILLNESNYHNFIEFPTYIQEKIDCGIITRTHLSDLLRLELLIKYGGTWIDSTVYFSGDSVPDYMLNSDLFLFQNLKPGLDGHCTRISSWFITSCTNNPILLLTRELLYAYWREHNYMIDYFLFHDMFELAIEVYPDEWNKVVPFCNSTPHILLLRLFERYNDVTWNALNKMTPFHKITYKFDNEKTKISKTFYDVLLK